MLVLDTGLARLSHWVVLAGLFALVGACSTSATTLEGDDDTLFPGLRVDFPVDRNGDVRSAVTLELTRGSGTFGQDVAAGQDVQLDAVVFDGPQTVTLDYELDLFRAGYLLRFRVGEFTWLEGSAGLALTELDATLSGAAAQESERHTSVGPFVRGALVVQATDALEFFLGGGLSTDIDSEERTVTQFELGGRLHLTDHLALLAAFRDLSYELESSGSHSDLDLGLSGPLLMLVFTP